MAIGIFKFIDINNHDQIVWATKYLMKKNLISVSAREQITAQTLDRALRSITNGPEALQMMDILELHAQMTNAWNGRKKRKSDRPNAAINLRVDKSVRDKFNELAVRGAMTQAELFTSLVTQAYSRGPKKSSDIRQKNKAQKSQARDPSPSDELLRSVSKI
ncbi:MAG: hypothetical protein CVV10_08540 [Gammaproteobacteria bacterium HGW-Gammaproteobacteria-14]|nr:MAG: hypothetical protein CVV10_08540 [Gammaproteobacteria bacterium HGW-Gammaproteobacteria-14]